MWNGCAWRDWVLRAVAGDPADLQILYGVHGERRIEEFALDWLPGYQGSRPVRIGNAAVHQFQKAHPCPATGWTRGRCPGYVVDHVKPLKRGGADIPANMQWQTKAEAKAKDRVE